VVYFALALFFSIGILLLFKVFKTLKINTPIAIVVSYIVSTIMCFVFSGDKEEFVLNQNSVFALILGISFFVGFIFLSLSTQKSGISITSVASNISVIIPVVVAAIFYHEKIIGLHLAGVILAIPAIFLIFKPKTKQKFSVALIIYPLAIFIISGFNNSILREAQRNGAVANSMFFLGIIFAIAFISSVVYTFIYKHEKANKTKDWIFGGLLGIANFASTYYFIKSLETFSSALFFPIYNISFIAISAFIGILFFKESYSKIQLVGLILAGTAVMLMNWN
jgi:drug/metabolite transporter (DMT)-like permease